MKFTFLALGKKLYHKDRGTDHDFFSYLLLDDQVFVNLPNFGVGKKF